MELDELLQRKIMMDRLKDLDGVQPLRLIPNCQIENSVRITSFYVI